ncbi:hypothetical protein E2C01_095347 [Portunus trituberculatus]|uniref:Uncharacterized protein n=1 Tax=Portunus trituberculatus TaxID=210409 RepID=A0A5B7JV07_PORTR|nr:hypothetical protein [Portunus trituberculatus]
MVVVVGGGGGGGGGSREVAAHSQDTAQKTQTEEALSKMMVYPQDATLYLGALFPIHASERDMTTEEDVCTYLQIRES